jgi:hypothetical protein
VAVEDGTVTDQASEQFAAYGEHGDVTQVITALDHQVTGFNELAAPEDPLVPVPLSGTTIGAVATYLVLQGGEGGAGWVSESDARIAQRFGDFLRGQVESGDFADDELQAVEDPAAALAQTTPEAVGQTVKSWQVGRQDLNVLFLIDRSSAIETESVDYGGGPVSAGDAAIRTAVATMTAMESTSRAGLWEFGVGADDGEYWRAVTDIEELSEENRQVLEGDMFGISENEPYAGGSPLYDSLVDAYQYMNDNAVDGAVNLVVVLTNSGVDEVSAPSVDDTAATLSGMAGSVTVFTVGFGSANTANLQDLAEATGGDYIEAPAEGGVLEAIGG